ncbi:MAG TPA: HD domain-containing phosphohydrolase [Holophagaceae bacterium]|nr:HD domain-containing phosphohydrolase [Holophagaceae bacterium]
MADDIQALPADTRILVVDDLPVVRLSLRHILQKAGYVCLEAASVAEALAVLEREHVDLILCDIEMPGGPSGVELVRALQPRIPEIAVVMVSAMDDTSLAIECIQMGAFGYVVKPFQAREILVQVNSALRRRMLEVAFRDREKELARKVKEQTFEIRNSREEIALRLLSACEYRDYETGAHVRRIGLYSAAFARMLGWDEDAVDCIQAAAPLHDIGKIGVPDAILMKPGDLTEAEWVLMKQHTSKGAAILKGSEVPFIKMGARIAACHHEKWDGSGYPRGLKGEQIPVEARIVSIVDVYDALVHKRHYKEPWPEDHAIEFMRKRVGHHLDPDLFDLFVENLAAFRAIRERNPDEEPQDLDELWLL